TYYEKVAEYAASKGEKPAEAYIYGWDIYVYEPVSPNADIVASADTYVDNEMWSRTSNNGNLTAGLIGDYSYLSYIRFDVKDVKYAYGRAKLSLWCKDSSPRKVGIYGISDNSWDEAALNWKTAPGIITTETGFDSNTTIKLGEIITSGAGRYELDISEYFAANKFNDAITVGIAGEDGNCAFFASKEDTNSIDRKPYLNVALDVSALTAKIAEANALADSIKVGAGEGECTQQAKDEFSSAIAAAQSVTDKWDAAESEMSDAFTTLDAAMTTLLVGHVASPGVELSGTDDAYIQKGNPDANYAGSESSTNLIVGNSGDTYLAYLKFDISAYPGEYSRAKLRFFSKDSFGYTLGIYGLSDTSWSESTLTWNNAPNRGDSGFGSGVVKIGEITTSGRQNYEFDLGTYFKAHNADDYISIGIAMETSNTNAFLSQGENADPSCRPILTLGLDASALEAAIDEARTLYDSTPVGLEIGNCTQQLKDNLAAAINAAEKVYGDYSKTKAEYTSAAESLNSAIESFRAGIVSIGIDITEMTVNGIPADTLSAGEVKVRVKVTNIGDKLENADIYFALMKETDEYSSLEDVDFKSVEVSADGNVICEGALTVDDAEGACIRIFCWDKDLCPKTVNLTK
ncbi:MAG: DNRLRE domain-containing protein, partial [Clostridia bacterium]|nr:DNRLRE domain-containing protein [Clostridia bacterium]